jgi:hypothetical protein
MSTTELLNAKGDVIGFLRALYSEHFIHLWNYRLEMDIDIIPTSGNTGS